MQGRCWGLEVSNIALYKVLLKAGYRGSRVSTRTLAQGRHGFMSL